MDTPKPKQGEQGKADYEVGYGRPPKHTRFKKGRSGNPKGRPKASKNMSTLLLEGLARPIPIKEDGKTRHVPFREAWVQKLLVSTLKGNVREQIALMKALQEFVPTAIDPEPPYPTKLTIEFVESDGYGGFKRLYDLEEAYKSGQPQNLEANAKPEDKEDPIDAAWRASGIDDKPSD